MFDCPATSAQKDTKVNAIRSVSHQVAGGAEKLRNVLVGNTMMLMKSGFPSVTFSCEAVPVTYWHGPC
jgi:hypothetical protein